MEREFMFSIVPCYKEEFLRGPTQNFGQKLQFCFLLKKHPRVCGKYVPKY